ncbi:autophagy protein Apg6 [Gregarina niphandrodes]|uniref:Autophagy protein Apg6 n=1 Tax=Gregarina niphandrodes TaxID=110365 RepID=A0A023B5M4_GRENI|nr:autophagy protein Apg6 [Gregarina niphandrodes]EZG61146.1 autophagy protein Apg6 [Gregarina niphandrodes]|eukprot:XP_011130799.1 autophagy protein Apg6 [Gregarina niphandrodes]
MLDQCCKHRLLEQLCDECLLQLSASLEELQKHEGSILAALQEPLPQNIEVVDWLDPGQYSRLCAVSKESEAGVDTENAEAVQWSKAVERNIRTRRILNINRQRLHENETCAVKMDSLCRKYERTKIVLLDTCFYISVFDDYGVINGCRIGRRPNSWVSSEEINTGLGYLALLVSTIRRRVFSFAKDLHIPRGACHAILARGRQSAITIDGDDQTEYPLNIVDGLLMPYFHVPKFDVALVGLLEIYRSLSYVAGTIAVFNLILFRVTEEGYVRGISIRYGNNEYE